MTNPNEGTSGTEDIKTRQSEIDTANEVMNLEPEGFEGVNSTVLKKDRMGIL